ncbi:uncharacterized protein LOC111572519 isoform X2 [Amphiprion ocellaris]|uniref:uncharacterized protein LOC111572519 isoform X2 n=1 Tax=Amphiprion ocellaris TaxID=80972 RepID=UPI0024113CD6|nr:uncharacterized protein LOC111572519 isoform X2 [Amphiprion ocellaris]
MANPTDDFAHTEPQSGEQAHSQETGDDGLSSKMKHNFSESYNGSALSVEEKGCCVRPIPKDEADTSEVPGMAEIVPHPSESQSVPAEVGVVQPGGLAVVKEKNLPPQFPLKDQLDNRKEEEEAVKALPGTRAITEADLTEVGGESCIMDPKMDTGKNPAKRAPRVPKGGRKRNRYKKRAAGNNWKLSNLHCVGLLLAHVAVCKGFPVPTKPPADRNVTCFTCNDYDKCQNPDVIFGPNDTLLYKGRSTDTTEECSKILPPPPKTAATCTVCHAQSIFFIVCPGNVTEIEAEKDGSALNTTKGCTQLQTTGPENDGVVSNNSPSRERFGLIAAVVGALVIFLIYRG